MTSGQWLVKAVKSGKDGRTEEWKRLSWVDWPVYLTRDGGQGISITRGIGRGWISIAFLVQSVDPRPYGWL